MSIIPVSIGNIINELLLLTLILFINSMCMLISMDCICPGDVYIFAHRMGTDPFTSHTKCRRITRRVNYTYVELNIDELNYSYWS